MSAAEAMQKLGAPTCTRCSAIEATEECFGLRWCEACLKIVAEDGHELFSIIHRKVPYQVDPGPDSADSPAMRTSGDFRTSK